MNFTDDLFYANLPLNHERIIEKIDQKHLSYRLPDTWTILMLTITGGDVGAKDLSHRRLLQTDCIVCVLNVFFETSIKIPYFFTNFGACFLMPDEYIDECRAALVIFEEETYNNFRFLIFMKSVSVSKVYEKGHELRIAKIEGSEKMAIPVIFGDGLDFAYSFANNDNG